MIRFFILFLLSSHLLAFVPFSGNFTDGKLMKASSGVKKPPYIEQVRKMEDLALDYPELVTVVHYGNSLGARELTGVLIKRPEPFITRRLSIITGATHGNEYLNIADRLAVGLLEDKEKELISYLDRGGSLFIVPVVNPDGYDRSVRGNLRGADLNRNWPGPSQKPEESLSHPETKSLALWIDTYLANNIKLDIALDYHCCASGMLLLPWGWKNIQMPTDDRLRSRIYEQMLAKHFSKPGRIGTPPEILYPAKGTTLDYWYDKYRGVSFTYEGRYKKEKDFLNNHIAWWSDILKTF